MTREAGHRFNWSLGRGMSKFDVSRPISGLKFGHKFQQDDITFHNRVVNMLPAIVGEMSLKTCAREQDLKQTTRYRIVTVPG